MLRCVVLCVYVCVCDVMGCVVLCCKNSKENIDFDKKDNAKSTAKDVMCCVAKIRCLAAKGTLKK